MMQNTSMLSLSILIFAMFFSCTHTDKNYLPEPKIQIGVFKVSGKITNLNKKEGDDATLTLYIPSLITAEANSFTTQLNEDGSFFFEVPSECQTVGYIRSKTYGIGVNVGLTPNEETKLEIICDKDNKVQKINVDNSLGLSSQDLTGLEMLFVRMLFAPHLVDSLSFEVQTPQDFAQHALNTTLKKRLAIAQNDSIVSIKGKNYITNEYKMLFLKDHLLQYTEVMANRYKKLKEEKGLADSVFQEPDRSYYVFLKDFDLNNSQNLYNNNYSEVLQVILSKEIFNIPEIGDAPIAEWLKGVKATMSDLIGSDTGMFYDLLAANAYARQFTNELKPLSEKQKENIKSYFKNKDITQILFNKNEKIIPFAQAKVNVVINETPAVSKDKLMDAIVSKYKGKVILVDFWETWCAPCLSAMKDSRELKKEMKDKGVVFVYISSVSSPQKLWKEKVEGIGGEHYYLTEEESDYLWHSFKLEGIPAYLFYDTKGVLKNKMTGYSGTSSMQKMIKELLP